MRTIVIGCDNAAVHLKNELMDFMEKKGYTVENMGCDSTEDSTYYPYVAEKVCQEIINSGYQKHGVLICGTGLGMAMTANKFKGIRAGVCHDIFSAERLKLSNDGNVICMGERVIGTETGKADSGKMAGTGLRGLCIHIQGGGHQRNRRRKSQIAEAA